MNASVLVPPYTAASLLHAGDSEFITLLSLWEQYREPPIPLADWLQDRDMLSQAAAVRWVLEQPLLPIYCGKGTSKSFPFAFSGFECWSWSTCGAFCHRYADRVDWLPDGDGVMLTTKHPTLNDALCYLLDSYPKEGL